MLKAGIRGAHKRGEKKNLQEYKRGELKKFEEILHMCQYPFVQNGEPGRTNTSP